MQILTDSRDFVGAGNLSWQQHMKAAVRSPRELIERLDLPENLVCMVQSRGPFPLFVPLPFLSRIEKGNVNDPLLRQVLPIRSKRSKAPGPRSTRYCRSFSPWRAPIAIPSAKLCSARSLPSWLLIFRRSPATRRCLHGWPHFGNSVTLLH